MLAGLSRLLDGFSPTTEIVVSPDRVTVRVRPRNACNRTCHRPASRWAVSIETAHRPFPAFWPQPGAHEVLCRVRAVTLCGTDPHIIQGHHRSRRLCASDVVRMVFLSGVRAAKRRGLPVGHESSVPEVGARGVAERGVPAAAVRERPRCTRRSRRGLRPWSARSAHGWGPS